MTRLIEELRKLIAEKSDDAGAFCGGAQVIPVDDILEIINAPQCLPETTKVESVLDLIPDADAKTFWKSTYEDGVAYQDLANELSDMYIMIENVPKVYMEVTGGLLSKHNYTAAAVISAFNNYVEDLFESEKAEFKQEIEKHRIANTAILQTIQKLSEDSRCSEPQKAVLRGVLNALLETAVVKACVAET